MKKIFYLVLGVAALASCQHDVVYEVDYNVTLDKDNTYFVGEPVKFNFTGEVDNIVFYSGEIGSQYMYRERYEVSAAEIESVALELNLEGQWGFSGGLDIYYTNTFNGLNGSNRLQEGTGGLKTVSIAVLPFAGKAGEILYQLQVVGEPFAAQTYGIGIGGINLGFVQHDVQLAIVDNLSCILEGAVAVLSGQKPFEVNSGVKVILEGDFRVFINRSDNIGVDPFGVAGNGLACLHSSQS